MPFGSSRRERLQFVDPMLLDVAPRFLDPQIYFQLDAAMIGPDFLIIGAARCGTTALTHFLTQHPEVHFSSPKETHFFAFANQSIDFRGPGDDVMMNQRAILHPNDFQKLFVNRGNKKASGEGSVSTLYYPQSSIPNIQSYAPNAKMIVVLRNPIERAFSSYMYMIGRGYEPETSFERALDLEPERIEQNWHHIWHYTRMGFYHDQLKAFLDAFGSDRIRVYLFDRMQADKLETLRDLFEFIGVDSSFRPNTESEINRSGKPKSLLIQRVFQSIQKVSWLREGIKSVVPLSIRDRIRKVNLRDERMNDSCRRRLTHLYGDEIQRIAKLLNTDLSHWMTVNHAADNE